MMKKVSKLSVIAMAGLFLAIPSISFSNQVDTSDDSKDATAEQETIDIHNGYTVGSRLKSRIWLGDGRRASSSASYYFNLGVSRYDEQNWDEAEAAFEKVLLSNDLHKQANFYLAHINAKQGEDAKVVQYVKAYHSFRETHVTQECVELIASLDLGLVPLIDSVNSGSVPPSELTSRIYEIAKSQGPEFARICRLVPKSRAASDDILSNE